MTPRNRPMRAHRLAGLATLATAAAFVPSTAAAQAPLLPPPIQAEGQDVDTTIRTTCARTDVASGPIRAQTIDVQVRGRAPLSAQNGGQFTFDGLTTRFVLDPDLMRPQVEGTRGTVNARLDSLALQADGGAPNPAPVVSPKAPLDLGTKPVKIASAPVFDAPVGAPKATFDPVGPWTVAQDAGGVAIGLAPFALTLTYYPEPTPTTKFAPTVISVTCKPQSPWFAKFPTEPPAGELPTVTGLTPNIGGSGTTVVVHGTGLLGATSVEFGGTPALVKLGSDTQLQAIVPTINWIIAPPPTLQWDVRVTTAAGISENTPADDFTFLTGTPFGPVIKSVAPNTVPLTGGKVRVTGKGFKGTQSVTVGKLKARFGVTSDASITVVAPAQLRRGTFPLTVTTPGGTATGQLRYGSVVLPF